MTAATPAGIGDRLKSLLLYPLPHHLLSALMRRLTRIRWRPYKNRQIRWFAHRYNVNLDEAAEPEATAYDSFNHFFTRALKDGARPVCGGAHDIACPADGRISQIGTIRAGRIIQAKGHDYSVHELLGGDRALSERFTTGGFATIYLSPRDYHRVHMPVAGRLRRMLHVPGRLFSVAPHTVRAVPRLFARNERVAAVFDTEYGPLAVVLVGALFVGSIETVWAGTLTPPGARRVTSREYPDDGINLARGEELGRFNMGSTVILLCGGGTSTWDTTLQADTAVRVGQRLGGYASPGD
jgi:phosphatidylserine decarboxylase